MTRDHQIQPQPVLVDELMPEDLDTVSAGEGMGAGKVNVQDLAFTHHYDAATPILTR